MTNSWKLGACAALCASVAFIGCSDDDDDLTNTGGSGGASGGKAGQSTGGSKAGDTNGGGSSAGKGGGGGTPGAGGKGGSGGNAGSAPMGGEGGALVGSGGAGGDAGIECTDDELGAGGAGEGGAGAGGTPGVTTAVILVDNAVVADALDATVVEWQFDDDSTISDLTTYPADKWSRVIFDLGGLGDDAGAHATFLGCDGDPADGSMKVVVPFSADNQYFELGCPFAAADYSNNTITARVKLISGGKPDAACPVRGELYITGAVVTPAGPALPLVEGEWITLTLELAAGRTGTDRVGIRFNTYGC